MIYIIASIILFVIIMQEVFISSDRPKIYLHISLFLYLCAQALYEHAFIVLLGGILFETSLSDIKSSSDNNKRVPDRFKTTLFISVLLSTFLISILVYNYKNLKIINMNNIEVDKLTIVTFAIIIAFFIKLKGKKWN